MISVQTEAKGSQVLLLFASAIGITLLLFFIDEGYYNFNWMCQFVNWIPFIIYTVAIFLCQWGLFRILPQRYLGKSKYILSIIAGAVLGCWLVISCLFS